MDYHQYKIINDPNYPTMKRVVPLGKGSVHLSLRGMYTGQKEAMKAIDTHEAQREVKEENNGTTTRRCRVKPV